MITNSSFPPAGRGERKTAQIRAKKGVIHSEEEYVTPTRARFLIDTGHFYLVNAPEFGPTEQPVVGPSETKPTSPSEKKNGPLRRRPGWPLDRFSTVERVWSDGIVVCIGGGPSLTVKQCAAVEEARATEKVSGVIAVNDAYLWAPWADACYFADASWWQWQIEGRAKPKLGLTAAQVRERFAAFAGQKCSIHASGGTVEDGDVHLLRNRDFPNCMNGLSLDPEMLVTGGNSGFQALNLAVLTGARTVILLGYDARDPDPGKPTHWHGGHDVATPVGAYELYRRSFKDAAKAIQAAGVRVINCSPNSAINCFEKMELSAALCALGI